MAVVVDAGFIVLDCDDGGGVNLTGLVCCVVFKVLGAVVLVVVVLVYWCWSVFNLVCVLLV